MATRIQGRRGTAVEWSTANPTLASGEAGYETDTGVFKVGNGVSAWRDLPATNSELYVKKAQFEQLVARLIALEEKVTALPTTPPPTGGGGTTPPPVTPPAGTSRDMGTGVAAPPAPPVSGDWEVSFLDNFSGTALDLTKWNLREPWQAGDAAGSGYFFDDLPTWFPTQLPPLPSVLEVKNGMLVMKIRRQSLPGQPSDKPFTGVNINTRGKYAIPSSDSEVTYTEVRYNTPSGRGIWTAPLWTMGTGTSSDGMQWPRSGEIDLPEFVNNLNDTGVLFQTNHWHDGRAQYSGSDYHIQDHWASVKDPSVYLNKWRTMGLLRTGQKLFIYDNGTLVKIWTRGEAGANGSPLPDYLFNYPHLLLIDMKNGGWGGAGYAIDQYEEGDMGIDYVVVYRLKSGSVTLPDGIPSQPAVNDLRTDVDFHVAGTTIDPAVFLVQLENDGTATNDANKLKLVSPSTGYSKSSVTMLPVRNTLGEYSGTVEMGTGINQIFASAFGESSEPWSSVLSNSYAIQWFPGGTVRFLKTTGWVSETLSEQGQSSFQVGTKVHWAIKRVTTGVQFFIWRNSEPRPTTPTYTSTDTAFGSGRMRISIQGENTAGTIRSYNNDWTAAGAPGTPSTGVSLPAKIVGNYWFGFEGPSYTQMINLSADRRPNFISAVVCQSAASGTGRLQFANSGKVSKAEVTSAKAAGITNVVLIGGHPDGGVRLTTVQHRDEMIASLKTIIDAHGWQGIDWDLEGGPAQWSVSLALEVTRALASHYGRANFVVAYSPRPFELRQTTTPANQYSQGYLFAKALHEEGLLDLVQVQFYDANEWKDDTFLTNNVKADFAQLRAAGIPGSKLVVGSITQATYAYGWNQPESYLAAYNSYNASFDDLRGFQLWATHMADDDDWAANRAYNNALGGATAPNQPTTPPTPPAQATVLANHMFPNDVNGFSAVNGTLSHDTTVFDNGSGSAKLVSTAAGNAHIQSPMIAIPAGLTGKTLSISSRSRASATLDGILWGTFFTADGTQMSDTTYPYTQTTANTWKTDAPATAAVPDGAAFIQYKRRIVATSAGQTLNLDNVQVTVAP